MDFLKSAVASAIAKGSSFPYTFGDRVDNNNSIWTLDNGTRKEDGSPCSIFTFDIAANKSRLPLAKNALRKLRTLRHPGVIKVLETIETEQQLHIVTERVSPLSWSVKRRSMSEETIKWGLYSIASTVKFINEDASSVHGALRVSSIYTGESGEWKLAGFEILSSLKEETPVIYTYGSLLPDYSKYMPPEISKGGWEAIKSNPLPAVDAYDYGALVYEAFNGNFRGNDQAGQITNIPPSMHQSYKRLMNPNPKLRLTVAHFLDQGKRARGFFQTPLIRLTQDIENLGLKSEEERGEFINELEELSDDYPEDFFKMKVLPELLKSVEFGGGGPKVLATILKIGAKLTDEEYTLKLSPVVVRLFANPDRAIRVCLLDNLPLMIDRLSQKTVNDKIFPQMLSGFTDLAPIVREQTVKAVLPIIGKLSDRTINGDLIRHLAKTANDEQPGIRTNTTICLGKIAKNLGQSSRSKVLIAAFSRSLRDPFVHARNAGLLALSATIDVFTDEDCAVRVLPAICPSLIDKEKLVRDQASKCIDIYLQRIHRYAEGMAETALPQVGLADSSGTARVSTPSEPSSWAGWAISSFTNKAAGTKGSIEPIQPQPNGLQKAPSVKKPATVPLRPTPAAAYGQKTPQSPHPDASPRITLDDSNQNTDEEEANEDAFGDWGMMDDMDENEKQESEQDAFFGIKTPPTNAPSPSLPHFEDDSQPDFAGWLAAQSKAKAKNPLSKGSNKGTPIRKASPLSGAKGIPKSPSHAAKKINTQPKEEPQDDDGWDAWN